MDYDLYSFKPEYTMGIKEKIYNQGLKAIYENYYEIQMVNLGLKYKF
ncbi:hypothetical protein [Parabacteroides sp. Marseille-P3160]|nr:hypothetical protein [Parabacteroides sp. Marseille-P3160]